MDSYKDKINWTLDQKIYHFFEVVDTYYHHFDGKVYMSFSGGKDSTVMKFLADKWCEMAGYEKIKPVFNNTTNEFPEILKFVKSFGDEVIWLRPKMTFAQTLKKYGFPVISKSQSMAISRYKNTKREDQKIYRLTGEKPDGTFGKVGVISKKWRFVIDAPFEVTNRCCDILKKEPVKRFEKETGLKPIIGTRAEESNTRRIQYIKNGGCNVWTTGKEKCMPLSIFTDNDINDIISRYNIELCSVYYEKHTECGVIAPEKGTGCMMCGFGAHLEDQNNTRFHRVQKRNPRVFKSYYEKLGYKQVLEFMNIGHNKPN